jgi:ADP-ribosylglycohydrolase
MPDVCPSRPARLAGGLYGLLVGDALGVPYEFHAPAEIPPRQSIDMNPPAGFARAHRGTPPGTWSDDGAQALALLASLLDVDGFDPHDFGARLVAWLDQGHYTPDRRVFDCGGQTGRALDALRRGAAPLDAGPAHESDNGNGSLMRVLPLALWHRGDEAELVELAHAQSRLTHGHLRAQVCCALYCLWARALLEGQAAGWDEAAAVLGRLYRSEPAHLSELEFVTRPEHGRRIRSGGYVLTTLWAARAVLEEDSYEAVLRAAIALGEDTDTLACVAGGLAGIRHGIEAIPGHWLAALRGRELVEPLLARLHARDAAV